MPFADGKRKHYGAKWRRYVRPAMLARSEVARLRWLEALPLRPSFTALRGAVMALDGLYIEVCECKGRCGLLHPTGRCLEVNRMQAAHFRGDVRLAVAHLDQEPTNNDPSNLLVLCQACHNRVDAPFRGVNAARTKRAQNPQLNLHINPQLMLSIVEDAAYHACAAACLAYYPPTSSSSPPAPAEAVGNQTPLFGEGQITGA